ncbi:dehydrogenase [Streptomyces eurocidicus]|uniref:Dehydrogenase n=1 Tax=Streptomyces eurocidicus TaxID=66423 RepID=A0A2N8P332_STREU|nr:Gfo/Idh/MocA family oxidoreductase [Streptomyces eurocidicus]MBB5117613.1 myo-inositol 2-dehydrogenase/D-chiro-inositol 1-dehydrogenase [Streptomyces eurocidicus]MBF6053451.1 dehydrogenase [Streptomyces eurocidicus]PNE35432.1 dehydrogenase [Streptomyces eurocidicus]
MRAGTRVGLLGAGRIGARHAAALTGTAGVAEVVVADADPDRAAAVARETGARAARTVDEVFTAGVDAVVVATPTATHAGLVGRAARAGLPAFCEKPLAPDLAGTEAALRAAEAAGTLLQIGFQRRFDAGFRAARRALRSGALGRVHTIRCVTSDAAPPDAGFLARSGGLIHDCMIHDFDAVRWLTGREVVEVYARGSDAGGPLYREAGDVDTACALLTLDDGTLVTVTATRCNGAGYDVRTELSGERDQWVAGLDARTPVTSAEPGLGTPPERPWADCLERFADAYRAELAAFVRAARGEAPNPCPGVEGLHALRIAVACETSRREGRPVRVRAGT